jgi:hypothetical protein|nr:MAG TPA: tail protein [Caudoviricetes sp.]
MVNYKINVYLKHTEMENMYVREFIELVTQDINGNNFEFTVYEDDNVYDLTNKRVTMVVKSDSGTVIQENCQVVDAKQGKATITLPPDMLIENGPYMAEVQIWEGVNSRVTTLPFDYTVRLSLENDESIKADPRFSLLQVALKNVNDADGKSKEALKLSKEAKAICDDLVPKANTASQNAQEALDRALDVATKTELDERITLDGTAQTKFDFIGSKIAQGWIDNSTHDFNLNNDDFSILFDLKSTNLASTTTLLHIPNGFQVFYSASTGNIRFGVYGETTIYTEMEKYVPYTHYIFNVIKINNAVIVKLNNNSYALDISKMKGGTSKILIPSTMDGLYNIYKVYNKAFEPIEAQRNYAILNNLPAIKEFHTTDSTGKTSILRLGSDEDHVEMASGRTLREEYMGVLKTMGKEFTADATGKISVDNGVEARLIGGEITGKTVKSLIYDTIKETLNSTNKNIPRWKTVNADKPCFVILKVSNVIGNPTIQLTISHSTGALGYPKAQVQSNGYCKIDLSNYPTENLRIDYVGLLSPSESQSVYIEEYTVAYKDDINFIQSTFNGLSSTQAIINNNGQSYPIYANEEDKANKKVISLYGIGESKDSLDVKDDGTGVLTKNVLFTTANSNTWTKAVETDTMVSFGTPLLNAKGFNNSIVATCICDPLKVFATTAVYNATIKGIAINQNGWLYLSVLKTDLVTLDSSGVNTWLTNVGFKLWYQLATPIVTHIPKELIPTILTHKTNILEVGGKVKASSFKVTLPVDKLAEIEARLQALESTTVDVVLNK